MSLLMHISDTHFGTERPDVVEALVTYCATLRPTLVVLSGDVTQRAHRSQFEAARAFVERLKPSPVLVIPGNHDIPLFDLFARFRHPYANHRRVFGEELEPSWQNDDVYVLGLNTTRARRHKDGEISPAQRDRVAGQLREATTDQLRVVVTHQPMHVTREIDESNLLHGGRKAAYAWTEAGVDLLMGGHIHLPYAHPLRERYADLPRDAWVVQAGTAVSHRVRGDIPNSVNLIHYTSGEMPRQCIVERCDYDHREGRFASVERKTVMLDRVG